MISRGEFCFIALHAHRARVWSQGQPVNSLHLSVGRGNRRFLTYLALSRAHPFAADFAQISE